MRTLDLDTAVLALHVLAATVWVGGQIVLAALVPALRRLDAGAGATVVAARTYAWVAWPAFAVLVLTGGWNIGAADSIDEDGYRATLWVKLALVAVSGLAAFAHQRSSRPALRGATAATALLAAVLALVLGVTLRPHG